MRHRDYIASMTPERLLMLASRPEGLRVSRYRRREEKVADRVFRLVKDGKLRLVHRGRDECQYAITDIGRAALCGDSA